MLKDRKALWIVEYVMGAALIFVVLPAVSRMEPGWTDAHAWAYGVFLACAGLTLIQCASSMRQRMKLAERIKRLEEAAESLGSGEARAEALDAGQKMRETMASASLN